MRGETNIRMAKLLVNNSLPSASCGEASNSAVSWTMFVHNSDCAVHLIVGVSPSLAV